MKNLKQLCLFLSVGGMSALSIAACGDDTTPPPGTAGTSSMAGTGTAGTGTAGTGTAGTGTAGTGTAGTGTAGTGTAGTGTAGTSSMAGTGGASGGSGGASGGSGGASGGSGGASGGSGGASGGSGGASGGSGGASGGSGGSGGGASADCTHWCSGAMGVIQTCAGMLGPLSTVDDCLKRCAKAPPADLACWNTHLDNINVKNEAKATHCPHATGSSPCNAPPAP